MFKLILISYTLISIASQLIAQESIIKYELGENLDLVGSFFVNTYSHILITQRQSTKSLLINRSTKSVSIIDPRSTFPGFNFSALQAQFYKDRILYTNAGPWGFTISLDNDDVRELNRFFLAPSKILTIPDQDYFFGFHAKESTLFPEPILIKYDYNGVAIDTTHYFNFRLPNILSRFDEFNLIYIHKNLLFSNPLDNELIIFDTLGNYLKRVKLIFKKFKTVNSDIKDSNDSFNMHKKFKAAEITFLRRLFKLNDDSDILVQYAITKEKEYAYCIFDGNNFDNKACFNSKVTIIGAIDDILYYVSYEEDKTYLIGKHISTFMD